MDTSELAEADLREIMVTEAPSATEKGVLGSIRSTLDVLPIVPSVGTYPFLPVELQKDVARLRLYYEQNGFPQAQIDYLARLDTTGNRISVLMTVREGAPLQLRELEFVSGSQPITEVLRPDCSTTGGAFGRMLPCARGSGSMTLALSSCKTRACSGS